MPGYVLSLCDYSGNQVLPWALAGYDCICVDLAFPQEEFRRYGDGSVRMIPADVRYWVPQQKDYAIVFAAPPCTNLAVSGARWFRQKGLRGLIQALEVVEVCRNICESLDAPWMLENPVSTLSTYWRKPDYTFDPHEYGGYLEDEKTDAYRKKTCLWTGGGFVMPPKRPVPPVFGSKMHLMPPSDDRAQKRSVTPLGFSRAVFEANSR